MVTCEIKRWDNFKNISEFYFTCNHVWLFQPLKLFQNYFGDVCHVEHVGKYLWAAISIWNNSEITSVTFPRAEIKLFPSNVDEGWNNSISRVTTALNNCQRRVNKDSSAVMSAEMISLRTVGLVWFPVQLTVDFCYRNVADRRNRSCRLEDWHIVTTVWVYSQHRHQCSIYSVVQHAVCYQILTDVNQMSKYRTVQKGLTSHWIHCWSFWRWSSQPITWLVQGSYRSGKLEKVREMQKWLDAVWLSGNLFRKTCRNPASNASSKHRHAMGCEAQLAWTCLLTSTSFGWRFWPVK